MGGEAERLSNAAVIAWLALCSRLSYKNQTNSDR